MGLARGLERGSIYQGGGHFFIRDGHDRGTGRTAYFVSGLSLLSFHINPGIHSRGSVQQYHTFYGYVGHNSRQAPTAARTPNLDRKFMGVDTTMLGSQSSLAPENPRSFANSRYTVSLSFALAIAHPLV